MPQAAQRSIVGIGGIDRRRDGLLFFGAFGLEQHAQPVTQEGPVARRVGQRQRIEPRRFARADAVVASANAAHEQFRAAILVEQDRARAEFLRLRGEEVHHHRLARTRGSDDREIAQVAMVEIEEERCRAGGFQQRHRLAPVIALGLPQREAVQ